MEENGEYTRGSSCFCRNLHMMKKYYQFLSESTEKVAYLHGKTLNIYKANYWHKIKSKWFKVLPTKRKTLKLIKRQYRNQSLWHEGRERLFKQDAEAQATKAVVMTETDLPDCIKIKDFWFPARDQQNPLLKTQLSNLITSPHFWECGEVEILLVRLWTATHILKNNTAIVNHRGWT